MGKLIVGAVLALALFATPSHAEKPAAKNTKSPAQACKTLRSDMGVATFRTTYRNFGKCVSQHAQSDTRTTEALQAQVNAAKTCKGQREEDSAKFAEDFGSGRNAFGKCVSR